MRSVRLMIPLLLMLALTGCWDKLELEEQAYTVVLGIDKANHHMVEVTFQIANPQVGSSDIGNAPNEPPSDTVTFTAPDVLAAKELANSVITRKISFAHLRTLVVSEEFARSDFFHPIISAAIRDPEMRREVNLIVSKEKASQFITQNKPRMETRPHKYFAFMQERWRDTGMVPYSTLNRYFTRLQEGTVFLAIYATTEQVPSAPARKEDRYVAGEVPQENGDPVQLMGSAVFKDGRMIGRLTGEETRYALFLRRKSLTHSFITTFPDPLDNRYRVSIRLVKNGNTKVKVRADKSPTTVQVVVPIGVQLLSATSFYDYALDKDKQERLQQRIREILERDAMRLVDKAQKTIKGDPFLWNLNARTEFWTRKAYEQYDWGRQFLNADVSVSFDLKLESFGKQLVSPRVGGDDTSVNDEKRKSGKQ